MYGLLFRLLWQLVMWVIEQLAATRHWRFTLSLGLGVAVGFLLYALVGEMVLSVGALVALGLLGFAWNLNRATAKEAGF